MKVKGFIMNRIEKTKYTNGDEERILIYITLLSENGIQEYYATETAAEMIANGYYKGDQIFCKAQSEDTIILGKKVAGRILAL